MGQINSDSMQQCPDIASQLTIVLLKHGMMEISPLTSSFQLNPPQQSYYEHTAYSAWGLFTLLAISPPTSAPLYPPPQKNTSRQSSFSNLLRTQFCMQRSLGLIAESRSHVFWPPFFAPVISL